MIRRPSPLTLTVALPLVIVAGGVIAVLALLPGAADPLAVHWGLSGSPDGFAAPWTVLVWMLLLGLGVPLLLGVFVSITAPGTAAPSVFQKLLTSVAVGVAGLDVALSVWTLASQRAGSEPSPVGVGVLIALGSAVVLGAVAWFVLVPADPLRARAATAVPAVPLAAGERAVWLGYARLSGIGLFGICAAVLLALISVTAVVFRSGGAAWPLLAVPAALVLLVTGISAFSVRVDEGGLVVRAALGVPVWRITPAQIESVGVTEVVPMVDFGGWGVRWLPPHRTAVVTRRGEALAVKRRDGRSLTVTVDDAGTAAGLLEAMIKRTR